jgi:N-carbamoyl-L-amino-acid hydrolase
VVSAIVGIRNFEIRFTGQQNHAGSTPMPRRRDAAVALLRLGTRIDDRLRELAGPRTVWTMGRLTVDPGSPSIIPGRAELHLQFRDPDRDLLRAMAAAVEGVVGQADAAGPVDIELEPVGTAIDPADMDETLQRHLAGAAAEHCPQRWCHMPSAAIHDAMFLATVMPAGKLFVPSIGGVSHDFSEDTADDDIVRGAQVLASAAASVLSGRDGASGSVPG